jgi:probable HAF family extracellular repeat protein
LFKSFIWTLFLFVHSTVFGDLDYRTVEISEVFSAKISEAVDISENGWVCGKVKFTENGKTREIPFVWKEDIGYIELEIPAESGVSVAINDKGQVAGNYTVKNTRRGFFWDRETGFQDIGDLGGREVIVYDINNHGQIVGTSQDELSGLNSLRVNAFVWKNGHMKSLDTIGDQEGLPGNSSHAYAINDDGLIIGFSNKFIPGRGDGSYSTDFLTVWDSNGIPREINIGNEISRRNETNLTNDGWFLSTFNDLYIMNIYSGEKIKAGYSMNGLANKNTGYRSMNKAGLFSYQKRVNGFSYEPEGGLRVYGKYCIEIERILSMNSAGDIVGSAKTVDGRSHAIILIKE